MRIRPFLMAIFLLVFVMFQTSGGGLVSARTADGVVGTWDGFAPGPGTQQMGNNTTAPPSFADLLPVIIFVLAGVGIAIVIVAVGLWVARRARRGKGQEGGRPGEVGEGEREENDEWGAKW